MGARTRDPRQAQVQEAPIPGNRVGHRLREVTRGEEQWCPGLEVGFVRDPEILEEAHGGCKLGDRGCRGASVVGGPSADLFQGGQDG